MTKHVFGNVPFFEHWNFQYTKGESAQVKFCFPSKWNCSLLVTEDKSLFSSYDSEEYKE